MRRNFGLFRWVFFGSAALFLGIGFTAGIKRIIRSSHGSAAVKAQVASPGSSSQDRSLPEAITSAPLIVNSKGAPVSSNPSSPQAPSVTSPLNGSGDFPVMDRVHQLFTKGSTKLPIVETITYESSVPWLKGRPAWLADYAAHYSTSRHFIARSLNGKVDYNTQTVSSGSRFNVFRRDKRLEFWLLVDVSRCKMGFYYVDLDTNERVLLKTYLVGVGRLDPKTPSGTLTPLGRYSLGNKIAVYSPGKKGIFQGKEIEMIRIFGTRWIPFDQEIEGCTASSKGYGIHGAPWGADEKTSQLVENREGIGKQASNGNLHLLQEDIEEIFSIVITKPAFLEIVRDFKEAHLPGIEVVMPKRDHTIHEK